MAPASRTGRILRRLVRVACARPTLTVVLALALAGGSVWYAVRTLTFATSTRALLPEGKPYIERYVQYDREFGELDELVIAVEAPSLPEATLYARRLVRELRTREVPLGRITYRIDPKQFEGRALLYMSKARLAEIRDKIFDYQEFVAVFAGRPTLDQLIEGVATQIANAFVTSFIDLGLDERTGGVDLRFIEELVGQISTRLDHPAAAYRSPWRGLFSVGPSDEASAGYFTSDDQRLLFILAQSQSERGSFTGDRRAIEGVRAAIAELRAEFPQVNVGVTGKPALSNDEMTAAFRDSERATLLAFGLTLGLLVLAFLSVGKPILMLLVLATSLAWSIGIATLVVGHLSLFSVVFISIVVGIGIDYGIYFLFRYEEELFLGRRLEEAIEITAARTGPGMLLGAATAAGTFYVLQFTDFRGVQELGFIAGTAILLAWLAMMTVFPAALVLVDRRHASRSAATIPRAIALERIRMPLVERVTWYPRTVLLFAAAVTLLSLWGWRSVQFDYNLLNLQAKGTESVVWERRILAASGRSGFAALASAGSLDELRRKQEAFSRLPSVSEVDSALLLIPPDQAEKQKIISAFAPLIAPIRVGRPTPVDLEQLVSALESLRRRLGIAANEAPEGETKQRLRAVTDHIERLIAKLGRTEREASEPALTVLQIQVYRDFVRNFQRLQANLSPRRIGLNEVPPEIRRKFIGESGRFLLQVHPAVDIWDRDGARQFVTELRAVDPDVTGTPIITYEAIRLMERAYVQGTIYAIVLVALITALTFRRWRETLLTLSPLGLGMVWTIGLMYFFDLKFTLGNVFGLPLILGAAAEFGSNIVLRFMEGGQDHGGPLVARSTVMAVLVNGLTTIVGFGSLMLADHRGIFGLGLLLTIGTVTSLVASLVVLPVLLRMVEQMRAARRRRRAARPSEAPARMG